VLLYIVCGSAQNRGGLCCVHSHKKKMSLTYGSYIYDVMLLTVQFGLVIELLNDTC
jgi:hypothetical protein